MGMSGLVALFSINEFIEKKTYQTHDWKVNSNYYKEYTIMKMKRINIPNLIVSFLILRIAFEVNQNK